MRVRTSRIMTGVRITSGGLVAVMETVMYCEHEHNFKSPEPLISEYKTKELLLKQTQGKFLTHEEKKRVIEYAEKKRKQRN